MAVINFGIPGMTISGRLNDVVYRTRNGKTYISSRPHRKAEPTQNVIKARKKFSFASKLAKSISEAAYASKAWENQISGGKSVFNAVFSSIFHFIKGNEISDRISVYPWFNSKLNLDSESFTFTFKNSTIKAAVNKNNVYALKDNSVKYLQMSVIFYCSEPLLDSVKPYVFLNLNSEVKTSSKKGIFRFSINPVKSSSTGDCLNMNDIEKYKNYDKHDVLIAIAALDENKNLLEHSNTLFFSNFK